MSLIILDRDGVINHDSDDYITSEQQWEAIPGSLQAIAHLSLNGYRIVVVSNQSALALGILSIEDLHRIHQRMLTHLAQYGGVIEAIFFCPHAAGAGCGCRKPATGLLEDISDRLRVSLQHVYFIGDKLTDIQAAQAIKAKPVLVRTGKGQAELERGVIADAVPVYDDLAAAAASILEQC